jgi:diguanylate cyclase (GGDEF)-like protein
VAQCLQETFRKNDFIARIGGDEFAVIIEELDEEMARERVSIFKKTFEKQKFFSQSKGNIKVTISSGIAQPSKDERLENLIHRADADMYASKREGKLAAVEASGKKK